jgi:hypothetical protein
MSMLFLNGAHAILNMIFILLVCEALPFYSFCQQEINDSDSGFCTFCVLYFPLSEVNTTLT